MVQEKIRARFGDYLAHGEVAIYSVLALLLFITALATIANAGKMLWDGLGHWTIAAETLRVLDQLVVVLMLVEILHTVRISIRSHFLVTEPFLVVGLIATIRRILVITLEAANLTKAGSFSAENANIFRASMIELGFLGLLILGLVFSITLRRRFAPSPKNTEGLGDKPRDLLLEMVGASGFEPPTSWSRTRRASQAALRPDRLLRN